MVGHRDFIEMGPLNMTQSLFEYIIFIIILICILYVVNKMAILWHTYVSCELKNKIQNYVIIFIILFIFCNSFALPGNYIVKNNEVIKDSWMVPMIPFIDKVYQIPREMKNYGPNKYMYPIMWSDGVLGSITFETAYFKNNGVANPEKVLDDAINKILIQKYKVNEWTSQQARDQYMYKTMDDPVTFAMNNEMTEYVWDHGLVPAYSDLYSNSIRIKFDNRI